MSRGPGKAQRAILARLADGPRTLAELRASVGRHDLARQLSALARRGYVNLSADVAALRMPVEPVLSAERSALTYATDAAKVYTGTWRALLAEVPECDALICDPPFSAKTHAGHDVIAAGHDGAGRDSADRRALTFPAWGPADVRAFVAAWAPRTRGWFVAITDHTLAPAWMGALEASGRYVFSPLPCIVMGGRVRLSGDGPSSITDLAIVARPRGKPWSTWGTLPGCYTVNRERLHVVGGKPLPLMRAIVEDYSRAGDLVCDPTCGGGTTLRAAVELGRRAVGGDVLEAHAHLAAAWLAEPVQQRLNAADGEQLELGQVAG